MKNLIYRLAPIFLLALCVLIPQPASADDPTISAQLSAPSFSVDRAVQLTVTVQGSNKAEVNVPEVEGLIIHDRGQNRFMQNVNGKTTYSYASMYIVQSLAPGKYTIPPISAKVKGTIIATDPIELEVLPSTTASSSGVKSKTKTQKSLTTTNQGVSKRDVAFVEITPEKSTGYVGEIIPVKIKAFFRTDLQELALPTMHGDGIVMPALSSEPEQKRELIDGMTYATLTWNTSITGVKEGEFPLHLTLDAVLLLKRPRGSSSPFNNRDPFGSSLFDDFFSGGYQRKNVQLKSDTTNLSIKPLPTENKPENFTGAIGSFSIKAEAEPQKVEPGEPVSLKIEITGNGNFDRVQCPEFPDTDDFKTYQPASEFDEIGKRKTFERAIIPKHENVVEIPQLSFTYFDPHKGEYVEIMSNALPLHVKGPEAAIIQQPVKQAEVNQEQDEQIKRLAPSSPPIAGLAPQKLNEGKTVKRIQPVYKSPWYLVALTLCFVIIFVTGIYVMKRRRLDSHPEILKRKQAVDQLKRSTSNLKNVKNNSSSDVLASARKEIQSYLGIIWDMEPSAITLADLQKHLDAASPLISLYTKAEQGAYGGEALTRNEIEQYIDDIVSELEKV